MAASLRVATWNANGLVHNKLELENFLHQEKIDIMLVSETHFTSATVLRIRDYRVYSTHHPSNKARGGAAVIIRHSIKHFEADKFSQDYLQAATVTVDLQWCRSNFSAVYCPPRYIISQDQFISFLTSLGSSFVAGGDFNCKHTYWGSRLINPNGQQLYSELHSTHSIPISTGKPTYWPSDSTRRPDLLDFFIVKGIPVHHICVEDIPDLSSDHIPVTLTVASSPIYSNSKSSLTTKYTDWDQFRDILHSTINLKIRLKTEEDIDAATASLISTLTSAAKLATPTSSTTKIPQTMVTYLMEVRELVAKKRKARRTWQENRTPGNKTIFNALCKQLHSKIQEVRNASFQYYVAALSPSAPTDYSLWKATKKIKRPILHVPPIRSSSGSWARSDEEKASVFADHLATVFQPNPSLQAAALQSLPTSILDFRQITLIKPSSNSTA